MDGTMSTLESQISTAGLEHNASLRQKLEELASAMDRLDARQALRQQRDTAQEMGIYESCVSALPDFSQAEEVHCPACAPLPPRLPNDGGGGSVPPWIRAEVDWRRQHTEVLNQRIEVLEREKSLWEQKLRKLRSNSPGTSSRNKIFQLFPKEPAVPADTADTLPGTVTVHTAHTAHAWGVGASALKGSARDVYEKMLNPQPLQFIAPPKRERERLQEEKAIEAQRKQQEEQRAEEDNMQQELGQHLANRQELRSALQRELQAMRCLEAERQRGREALRATLQDELQQQLRQEKRAWQVEQERQALQRRAQDQRRAAVHREMQQLELERLLDKLALQRSLRSQQPCAAFDEEKLLELWKLRLAKDPLAEDMVQEIPEVTEDLPAELLGMEEWLLFYGDLLNGTSRDKVADIDALEQAFMVISRTQNCFDMAMVNEAKESLSTPGVVKMMLSYWLQHCDARWRSSLQEGNLIQPPEGDEASIHSSSPLEDATVQPPAGRQGSLSRTSLDSQCHVEEDGPENAWPSRASVPEDHQQTASLTQTLDPENAQRSQPLADEAGAQLQHTRTSLASRLQIQRHDDAWGEAASQTGQENHKEEAAVSKERHGSHSGSKATNDKNLAWQRTRTSLASRAPVQRHDDDAWESSSHNSRGSKGPKAHKKGPCLMQSSHTNSRQLSDPAAADAKAFADHHRTSGSAGPVQKDDDGWGSDGWGSARPSQASVPEDHKKQAASLTQSLYARYAERSDPAAADDAKAPADHQKTSATVVQQAEYDVRKVSSAHSGQDLSAPKPSDADQAAETVEEEEEVFTKEQWVNWFKTAELEEEEILLLQKALQSLQDQQQLSPEEIAEALGAYQDVPEEDQDQLKEWAQWALEINDSD